MNRMVIRLSYKQRVCVIMLFSISLCCAITFAEQGEAWPNKFQWSELPQLPNTVGLAGSFAGVVDDILIVAGGANFPDGPPWLDGKKVWHDDIYLLRRARDKNYIWTTSTSKLPRSLAYGVSIPTESGLICIGGCDANECYSEVFILKLCPESEDIIVEPMPSLPCKLASMSGAILDSTIYIAGGQETVGVAPAVDYFFALDLSALPIGGNLEWKKLSSWPGPSRICPVAVRQNDGFGNRFYIFSGRTLVTAKDGQSHYVFLKDGYSFCPMDQQWRRIADLPRPACAGTGIDIGQSHILIFGGADGSLFYQDLKDAHPGFRKEILCYHTITDTWREVGVMPASHVTTTALYWGKEDIIIPSGEIHPGIRSPKVMSVRAESRQRRFGFLNYVVVIGYLLALVIIGFYFSKREKTTKDFFLGGRRVPWLAAALSIFGTQLSAITFMAMPSKVYSSDCRYFIPTIFIVLVAAPMTVFVFIPFYRRLNVTTAYEYLEKRFNTTVRLITSFIYVLSQIGRMAVVIFLPALALSAVIEINIYLSILIIGLLCTVYTFLGGIEAVIWTDVLQVLILMLGAVVSLIIIISNVPGGISEIFHIAYSNDKLRLAYADLDLAKTSVLVILLTSISAIMPYTSDQTVIQRYLTTRDEKASKRSMWMGAFLTLPSALVFSGIGIALYAFYKIYPSKLDIHLSNDSIFPWFIASELPVGVAGLIVGGIFAAAMSSLDSSMNSAATAITTDFYRRFWPVADDKTCLKLARFLVVLLGTLGTGTAIFMAGYDIESLWDQFTKIIGLLGGGITGVFLLGAFTRRTHGVGAVVGLLVTGVVMYVIQRYTQIHFFLYGTIGILTCMFSGYFSSLVIPMNKPKVEGLTVYSLYGSRSKESR